MGPLDSIIEIDCAELEKYRKKCKSIEEEIFRLKLDRFRQRQGVDVGSLVIGNSGDTFKIERIFFDDGPEEDTVNIVCRKVIAFNTFSPGTVILLRGSSQNEYQVRQSR